MNIKCTTEMSLKQRHYEAKTQSTHKAGYEAQSHPLYLLRSNGKLKFTANILYNPQCEPCIHF